MVYVCLCVVTESTNHKYIRQETNNRRETMRQVRERPLQLRTMYDYERAV